MNERSLVNKVIALLSFGQTQVVVSFRFDVYETILFVFLQWLKSQFEMPVFVVAVMFFKFLWSEFVLVECGIEIDFFFLTASIERYF